MTDTIIVKRSGQAPLRVRGELIASNSSSSNNASPSYSGSTGRSQKVNIYRTTSGKCVVAIHHNTCWQGEHDSDEAAIFPSPAECITFLKDRIPRWMVDELVQEIGEEKVAEDIE